MSAIDSETRKQAKAVADGCYMMALRLAEKIDRGDVSTPVAYAPGCQLTIRQIREAGIKHLEGLLTVARDQKTMGSADAGTHKLRGAGATESLTLGLAQWSGFKPSLRIDWKTIGTSPAELRELAEHYRLEQRHGVREVLQALPAA